MIFLSDADSVNDDSWKRQFKHKVFKTTMFERDKFYKSFLNCTISCEFFKKEKEKEKEKKRKKKKKRKTKTKNPYGR